MGKKGSPHPFPFFGPNGVLGGVSKRWERLVLGRSMKVGFGDDRREAMNWGCGLR